MLVEDPESRYSAHRCWQQACQLDISQFCCSTPTPASNAEGNEQTTIRLHTENSNANNDMQQTVLFQGANVATDPHWRSDDDFTGLVSAKRQGRSGASPPESSVSAFATRRKRTSQVSGPSPSDRGPNKRRGRSESAARELEYFFENFSNPLHALYVGSSLAEEDSGWINRTDQSSVVLVQCGLSASTGSAASQSTVLQDWYHDPRWVEPNGQEELDAESTHPWHEPQEDYSNGEPANNLSRASDAGPSDTRYIQPAELILNTGIRGTRSLHAQEAFPSRVRSIVIRGHRISLCMSDCYLNAHEICAAAVSPIIPPSKYIYILQDRGVVSERNGQAWVPFEDGCFLSQKLGLDTDLRLLFSHATMAVPDNRSNYFFLPRTLPPEYNVWFWNGKPLIYKPGDQTVNATKLVQLFGLKRSWLARYLSDNPAVKRTIIVGGQSFLQGTYIMMQEAVRLCHTGGMNLSLLHSILEKCGLKLDINAEEGGGGGQSSGG